MAVFAQAFKFRKARQDQSVQLYISLSDTSDDLLIYSVLVFICNISAMMNSELFCR